MKITSFVVFMALATSATKVFAEQKVHSSVCSKPMQGFFFGGNIGYGVIHAKNHFVQKTNSPFSSRLPFGFGGVDGGINVGYTYVFDNNIGLGLEFVSNWSNASGNFKIIDVENGSRKVRGAGPRLKNSLQLRGNFSYTIAGLVAPKIILGWDNSLWKRHITVSGTGVPNVPNFSLRGHKNSRRNGFLWGFGVDFLAMQRCIIGLEYTGTIVRKQTLTTIEPVSKTIFVNSLRQHYNKFALVAKFVY